MFFTRACFDVVVDAIDYGVVTVGVRDTTLSVADSASITVAGVMEGTIEVQNAQGEVGKTSFFGFTLDTPIVFHITFESPFDLTALDLSALNGTIVDGEDALNRFRINRISE